MIAAAAATYPRIPAAAIGGYAFAFVTATMGSHARATAVDNAFRGCIGVPPLDDLAAGIRVN